MTKDFARPYQNVPYFGIWAEETADDYGKRDAATIVRDAVMRCVDEDMRTPEVFAALDYLAHRRRRRRTSAPHSILSTPWGDGQRPAPPMKPCAWRSRREG